MNDAGILPTMNRDASVYQINGGAYYVWYCERCTSYGAHPTTWNPTPTPPPSVIFKCERHYRCYNNYLDGYDLETHPLASTGMLGLLGGCE